MLQLQGAVGPATADYLTRGIEAANQADARLIVIQVDTPGGLDKSMRDIIQSILASRVPVAVYVAPGGARAASAGTYILYASHIAAMAPATNLGAATPVQIGAPGLPQPETPANPDRSQQDAQKDSNNKDEQVSPEKEMEPGNTMERKIINDASAYIRSLAELRGRNADWAVKAVRGGESLSSKQALEMNVIDLIADNLDDLLAKLDGREVSVAGEPKTLHTKDLTFQRVEPDWRNQFLAVITDPSVAYILMLVGIYGLVLEFYNPGGGVAGILGGISLLIALYALQILPISYTGLALMLLGLGLMVAEAMSPSFGILGIGGVIAFAFGSVMLMDTKIPAFRIAWPVILAVTALSGAIMIFAVGMIWRARKSRVVSGASTLLGQRAPVITLDDGQPLIELQGERWQITCNEPLTPGDRVRVTDASRLILKVQKES